MHIVDILIIIAYIIVTLYIGFKSGKKIKTFGDYAIGNRKFSDFAIFCTVVASIIGGNATIGSVGKVYEIGITQILAQIGLPISYILVGFFLIHRFVNYYGCYSLGDIFYKAYGMPGKVLAGIIGSFYDTIGIGLQFISMGIAIGILTGLSYTVSLLVGASIILIYTGRGGIRAVTFTDVLQFMILILAIPILLMSVWSKIGGFHVMLERLPQSHITISGANFHRYLFLIIPMMLPTFSPMHTQRLLMTKSSKQGTKAYCNLCWISLFICIMTIFLGLEAKVLFPNLLHSDQALFTLVTNCLPVGVFGIAAVGILAILMSTADSCLNTSSIMLVNDVIIPYNKCIKKKELTEAVKLKWVRRTSLLIGIGGVAFASLQIGLFESQILARTLWFSIILSPLYFLLFNMKIPLNGLFISAGVGFTTCILWNYNIKPITKIDGLFPGFFANIVTVVIFYIIGGRQKVFTKEELARVRQTEALEFKKRPSVRELQIRNNVVLGLCLVFLQLMPLVLETGTLTYSKLVLTLINGTMAILLIFGGSLEIFAKEERFQWLKMTTLFFCLPVTSAYLVVTSSENGLSLITLLLSFIVMFFSVKREYITKLVYTCGLIGLITAIVYFKIGREINWISLLSWHHLFYILGFLTVLFLIHSNLYMMQQEKENAVYRERYTMARDLTHDLMSPLMVLQMLIDRKRTGKFEEKEYQLLKSIANEMGGYINDFVVGGIKTYEQLSLEDLKKSISSCIEKQEFLNKNVEIKLQTQGIILARVDGVLLRRIVNNLLSICVKAMPRECDTIVISIGQDAVGNAQIQLQVAEGNFSAQSLNNMFIEDQALGEELQLGISFQEFQSIVEKWHGKLEIVSQEDKAIIQILLPNEDHNNLIQ